MKIIEYGGKPPSALGAPDVAKILELFRQQNEVLRLALTTVVLVPEGTKISTVEIRKGAEAP